MPRSALVIGIGGTGQWVLSWLKRDLIESYVGEDRNDPTRRRSLEEQPIRLLLLDTDDLSAQAGGAGQNQGRTDDVVGYSKYITLDRETEYLQLPINPDRALTQSINQGVHDRLPGFEHITKWFAGGYYPDSSLSLRDGAAQFRQLGRLSLIQGLHLDGANDRVYQRLAGLMNQIASRSVSNNRDLDVHIVGSLAGGTGSGLFIDIAWLVRHVYSTINGSDANLFMYGFFALPSALRAQPDMNSKMKAFAAWRELNRMMTVKRGETSFLEQWGQRPDSMIQVEKPVYEHVYLVDKVETDHPRESTYPSMAEAVSFYIDGQAGATYKRNITTNLANPKKIAPLKDNPTYSVLNVTSWKLPIYHNVRMARIEFALKFLDRLLQVGVREEPNPAAPSQKIMRYVLDSNPMYRQRAVEVLNQTLSVGNTRFLNQLVEVLKIPDNQYNQYVKQMTQYGQTLLQIYSEMPQTVDGAKRRAEMEQVLSFTIPEMMQSNNNRELQTYMQDVGVLLYGHNRTGGKYVENYGDFAQNRFRGRLYDVLMTAHDLHLAVFQARLREWVRAALNERSDQPYSGLACVKDALEQLGEDLKKLVRFYSDVQSGMGNISTLEQFAQQQYSNALAKVQQAGMVAYLTNVIGGGAKGVINSWLNDYEIPHLYVKQGYRTLERILGTLEQMTDYVEKVALSGVRAIEAQLVTDNRLDQIDGLYRGLVDSLQDQEQNHAFDQSLRGVMTLLDDDNSSVEVDYDMIDELLKRTQWNVDDFFNLRVEIHVSPQPQDAPIVLQSNLKDTDLTRKLVNQLIENVASYVVYNNTSVSAFRTLGMQALERALPAFAATGYLFAPANQNQNANEVRTFYVRGYLEQTERDALEKLLARLNIPRAGNNVVSVVDSESQHKIVVFSARELLLPENFSNWAINKDGYSLQAQGNQTMNIPANPDRVRNDHLFAAEREAVRLEIEYARQYQMGDDFVILDQRLVHLLENHHRFDAFLRMWAKGWIGTERLDTYQDRLIWRIQLPQTLALPAIDIADADVADMLGVVARYVSYGRGMNNRDINFKPIIDALETDARALRRDKTQEKLLADAFEFEAKAARDIGSAIVRRIVQLGEWSPELMSQVVPEVVQTLTYPALYELGNGTYRPALAEFLGHDFARFAEDGLSKLVSNQDAHLQALQIVLPLKFSAMARGSA